MKVVLLDNFDSFTYNLYDYLLQLDVECTVLRNDTLLTDIIAEKPDAIVLSPGPQTPDLAGCMPEVIRHFHSKVPMLGICLGHQALGEFFGAKLIKAKQPVHGKTSTITHHSIGLFKGLESPLTVMRYHSLILVELASTPLVSLATTEEGELMALRHDTLPLFGVQFHPESILTQDGLKLLRNWVRLAENYRR